MMSSHRDSPGGRGVFVLAVWVGASACAIASPVTGVTQSNPDPRAPVPVVMVSLTASLKAGEGKTYDLPIDASVARLFVDVVTDPNVTDLDIAFLDPSGKSHDGVADGDDGITGLTQEAPAVGLWKVRLRAGSDIVYSYEAHADSPLVVTAETDGEAYASGAPIEFTAKILNAGVPVTGARVEAWLIPDRDLPLIFQIVPLEDRGDGSYVGRAVPTERGTFRAEVVARGDVPGGSFQRAWALRHGLGVIPDTLKILSARAVTPEDPDGNGRFEKIPFDVMVDVRRGGKFVVTSHLSESGGAQVAWRTDWIDLSVGLRTIRIAFIGSDVVRSGRDGPYHLRKVVIQDMQEESAPPIEKTFSGVEQRLRRDQLE
ncbi:MAG: hypothetical protein HY049_12270 [Acidobacteria bacterium]|nr:hypothetical protein [Acidobacteriota bacterium]